MKCPECKHEIPEDSMFCYKCGCQLIEGKDGSKDACVMDSERKLVTVMFSDMSGYTAMTERLDPEEVKAIMSQIFGRITEIIKKYDGFIERFIGDAVMAVFGVPKVHEDDPIRAIRAALEIHDAIEDLSPQFEDKISRSLTMHTGINTGLVVTGEVDLEKGTHGLTGDAINLASRMEGLAKSGEILVGESTYQLSKGYFNFESLEPTHVKGKSEPVPVYKVFSVLDQQVITKGLQGVQAELIGRESEMRLLLDAVQNLKQGKGSIVTIVGDAGTGKSRLVRELKNKVKPSKVRWREGHAYPYTKNIAYYPLTNLLTFAFQIREGDKPDQIRKKLETGVQELLWNKPDAIKYLGGLFSISYAEIDEMSPEFWQKQLHLSVRQLLDALASRGPTVILFEDLHWADGTFIELLHSLFNNTQHPVLFLCVYRPTFSLFSNEDLVSLKWPHHKIELRDMSWDQTQEMLKSLLNTKSVPDDLRYFIKQKVEGNPFFLEEVINTLIETGILVSDNESWKLTRYLDLADIPPTIQGVLTARLDRLEIEAKRILQEASVIGRAFFYEVLTRVTELAAPVDTYLSGLESLDLIRARSREPDIEYIFKHAITQEVVYNGLLKKERRDIHERTGQTIETLFSDRLPEFYEALAYHYSKGLSQLKAVRYLVKSGYKSYIHFSLEESNQYHLKAYEILIELGIENDDNRLLLVNLLNQWALVCYFRGDFKGIYNLYKLHIDSADKIDNKSLQALYYGWFGFAGFCLGVSCPDQLERLHKALKIAQETDDTKVVGYISAWLSWVCGDFGLYDEGILHGERSIEMAKRHANDQYLQFKGFSGLAYVYFWKGNAKAVLKLAEHNLNFAKSHKNPRAMAQALIDMGFYYSQIGDFEKATDTYIKATAAAGEPFYSNSALMGILFNAIKCDMIDVAKQARDKHLNFLINMELGWSSWVSSMFSGVLEILDGRMKEGFQMIMAARRSFEVNERRTFYIITEYLLGRLYSQMAMGEGPKNLSIVLKNIGFIAKHLPFAAKKAENYYKRAIKMTTEIEMNNLRGLILYDLGLLYKFKNSPISADNCFTQALQLFDEIGATINRDRARKQIGID